jgi:putative PIN family toxin of toxin-antitoxin system
VRVVVDTNVFVSGVFFGGEPGKVLEAWRDGRVEIVVSAEILEEYVRVGAELAARFPGVDLDPALELLATFSTLVAAPPLARTISEDPDDDKFLACAVAAKARFVVSGDRHLLDVSPFGQIEVLRPRELLARLA